jgi:signal transduction histidine kinase
LVLGGLCLAVAVNGVLGVAVLRGHPPSILSKKILLPVDIAIAVGINLAVPAVLPTGTLDFPYGDVAWFYLQGSAALCVAYGGAVGGAAMVAAGVPVQLLMGVVNEGGLDGVSWSLITARSLWLTVAVMSALLVFPLYRAGGRRAAEEGLALGRTVERAEQLRETHDTVLQTLHSIALRADAGLRDPEVALRQLESVRDVAREQAGGLRQGLSQAGRREDAQQLIDALREAAARSAGAGVRVRLELGGLSDGDRHAVAVPAMRGALREALANVWKHARVSSVVVRAVSLPDRVEVTVIDRGRGAALGAHGMGFGLRESVIARMRDAGGGAAVWSRPGVGTTVLLWARRGNR